MMKLVKSFTTIVALAAVGAVAQAQPPAGPTQVYRSGSGPARTGDPANFTGAVTVTAPFRGSGGARVGGATVTFAAGARTAWHSHPLGQTLVVVQGCGLTQARGGSIERICAGDVAWIGPGQEHWHGATPDAAMTHVAVSETEPGREVVWSRHVTEAEYRGRGG